jgi:hypothetical protein
MKKMFVTKLTYKNQNNVDVEVCYYSDFFVKTEENLQYKNVEKIYKV